MLRQHLPQPLLSNTNRCDNSALDMLRLLRSSTALVGFVVAAVSIVSRRSTHEFVLRKADTNTGIGSPATSR
jgi:hypothetical protein